MNGHLLVGQRAPRLAVGPGAWVRAQPHPLQPAPRAPTTQAASIACRKDDLAVEEPYQSFVASLLSAANDAVYSLPRLFLLVLTHSLKALRGGASADFHPSELKRLLFVNSDAAHYPLFLYDPLRTVYTLLEALIQIWNCALREDLQLDAFRLVGPNLVRGKSFRMGRWITLLAYCGGRQEHGPRCGYSPLVYGRNALCQCGKLICPMCGFCSEDCARTGGGASL